MSKNTLTVNEATYRALKEKILFGGLLPGKSITLRGLAEQLNVSPTPVRETVRRLISERALVMHDNRRVSIPTLNRTSYNEIRLARALLEPELAGLAYPNIDKACIRQLESIDRETDLALDRGDIEGYMRGNYNFHCTIYKRADSEVILALIDSLWLQFGPFMRQVCGRFGTASLDDQHHAAIDALNSGNIIAFKNAIRLDVEQGMGIIGEHASEEL